MLREALWVTALAGMGGTGLGGLLAGLFRREDDRVVSALLSFAAGVMTAVVCFDLLESAVGDGTWQRLALAAGGVLVGYGVTGLLNAWIAGRRAETGGLFLAGLVMAAAIALHNVPEGMVIGVSFAKEAGARSGAAMAAVIGLHNVPEGMAVAVPLIAGGAGRAKAALLSAVTGAPTVLGALTGYWLGTIGPAALALSLSFASGAMLYVVFGELLPEAARLWRSHLPALAAVVGMLVGLVVVYA